MQQLHWNREAGYFTRKAKQQRGRYQIMIRAQKTLGDPSIWQKETEAGRQGKRKGKGRKEKRGRERIRKGRGEGEEMGG